MLTSCGSFCEEDYAISFYLAEFVNALTNVTYGKLCVTSLQDPESWHL
jgi:dihydroceramidase